MNTDPFNDVQSMKEFCEMNREEYLAFIQSIADKLKDMEEDLDGFFLD